MKKEKQNKNVRVTPTTQLDAAIPSKRKDARHEGTREEASTKKRKRKALHAAHPVDITTCFWVFIHQEGAAPNEVGSVPYVDGNAVAGAIRIVVTVWVTTVATLPSWSRVPSTPQSYSTTGAGAAWMTYSTPQEALRSRVSSFTQETQIRQGEVDRTQHI